MAAAVLRTPRGVDQYRDTSLDGLIGQEHTYPKPGRQRGPPSNGRRSSSDTYSMASSLPPAPDVPRGPPIAYRGGPPPQDPNGLPQRSFSQRARARPELKETYADEGAIEDDGYQRALPDRFADQYPRRGERPVEQSPPLHINTNISQTRPIRNTAGPSPVVNGLRTGPPRESYDSRPQPRQVSAPARQYIEPLSATTRSSAAREMPMAPMVQDEDQRRDWAPDRSPLQKLEVTLNDISKEEKRARVEEAEMILREAKAGRGGRGASREVSSSTNKTVTPVEKRASARVDPKPETRNGLEDAGLVRNLSTTQRDRLQHSTTIDSKKPDVKRLSGDGRRGFDYEEQEYQPKSARRMSDTYSSPHQEQGGFPVSGGDLQGSQRKVSSRSKGASRTGGPLNSPPTEFRDQRQQPRNLTSRDGPTSANGDPRLREQVSDSSTRFPQHNPAYQNNQQSPAYTVPSNITRAVSMQGSKPPVNYPEDRDVGRSESFTKNTNTSHRGALAGAVGVAAAAAAVEPVIGRSGSKKLQKAPPQGYDQNKSKRDRRFSFEAGAEPPLQQTNSVRNARAQERGIEPVLQSPQIPSSQDYPVKSPREPQTPVGLGLRNSSGTTRNLDKPLPPHPDAQRDGQRDGQRPRATSVSFKEPAERARTTDEWKNAGTARLAMNDFALDEPAIETDSTWWEKGDSATTRRRRRRSAASREAQTSSQERRQPIQDNRPPQFNPPLFLRCGPLLRYTGLTSGRPGTSDTAAGSDEVIWKGTVMIVTHDSRSSYDQVPRLRLYSQPKTLLSPPPHVNEGEELAPEFIDPIAGLTKISRTGTTLYVRPVDHLQQGKDLSLTEDDNGIFEASPSPPDFDGARDPNSNHGTNRVSSTDGQSVGKYQEIDGIRLYTDPVRGCTFWRFHLEVELGSEQAHIAYRINNGSPVGFWVPSRHQSMNLMFHSCNGFSMSVDADKFGGPDPLWRDVLNAHQTTPFHAMIGGGDQIYNDRVSAQTKLFQEWTMMRNPEHKHHAPLTQEMREELETFYLDRYCMWFSQGLFGMANSQIPMINVWDDHDIIDGKCCPQKYHSFTN